MIEEINDGEMSIIIETKEGGVVLLNEGGGRVRPGIFIKGTGKEGEMECINSLIKIRYIKGGGVLGWFPSIDLTRFAIFDKDVIFRYFNSSKVLTEGKEVMESVLLFCLDNFIY